MEQITHRVDKDLPRSSPLKGLGNEIGVKGYRESIAIPLLPH
jgi:hypothetical protein